ncbi:MAG: M1 family peptidase, partial [Pyrinomonadaceae bacterium]|nr:M1 family peptidase [Pyrinomonadaceae bacterium]
TEAVNGSIKTVTKVNGKTDVTIHQAGEMPSPIVLKVELEPGGNGGTMPNAKMVDANTAIVTWPESVWFDGDRDEKVVLDFGGRKITKITFDPFRRFPDSNPKDNVWVSKSNAK